MKILECQKPSIWEDQIRQIHPMEKWFFRVEDKARVLRNLSKVSTQHGMKYMTKQWDRDYQVVVILEEWR